MRTLTFQRFAGLCALGIPFGAITFAALFITIVEGGENSEAWFALLLVGGVITIPVMIGVYGLLRPADEGFATLALVLGLLGALGEILHGGYELAAQVTPPPHYSEGVEGVSKGVLRYLVAGLALLVIGWLITRSGELPTLLGYLALFGGVLLVVIYFGRLYDFITPASYKRLIPPILYGFVVHPFLYGWLGLLLWRADVVAGAGSPSR